MKKSGLFFLSIVSLLSISACDVFTLPNTSSSNKQEMSSSIDEDGSSGNEQGNSSSGGQSSSSNGQGSSSSSGGNTGSSSHNTGSSSHNTGGSSSSSSQYIPSGGSTNEVVFNPLHDNCMVSPKIKAYVDAMEAQERTLDKPYHFSSLYGPDDYAKIAAASDKADGTTYAAADTGGVDVCQMLNRNDYNNKTENYPIILTWSNGNLRYNSAKLKFWSEADQSDLREVSLSANATSASLPNLYRSVNYKAQLVTDNGETSNICEFVTGDYPRVISFGGIANVRDIGGYMTSYGVRTKQGLLYRGYYIDDGNPGSHGKNYTEETGRINSEVLKIGVELDLQKSSETGGRTKSALAGAEYQCLTLVSYENFLGQDSYKNLPAVLDLIANADQKHVYFHCWGGADRTGMLAFFINAICGVSYTDLIEDFEITTETNNKRCHMHNSSSAHFPKFLNAFINGWSGYDASKTINENCEKWLLEVPKISPSIILKIRQNMIPGYQDGMKQNIPTYTPTGEWITDDLAHWKVASEDANVKVNWGRHKGTTCSVCGHSGSGSGGGGSSSGTTDYTEVLPYVWTVTKKENNSDGKEYEQIKDNDQNKVGVRILTRNYSSTSAATYDGDGKLPKTGESVKYQIKAPKAGTYQMVMKGRVSDTSYNLGSRGITVTVNGANADIQGSDRNGGLNGTGDNEFVIVPSLTLTGNEDTITVACRYYRIAFALDSYVTFAEH